MAFDSGGGETIINRQLGVTEGQGNYFMVTWDDDSRRESERAVDQNTNGCVAVSLSPPSGDIVNSEAEQSRAGQPA